MGQILARLVQLLGRFVAQPDKLLHLVGGLIVAGVVLALTRVAVLALWAGAAVAWLKERYDKAHPDRHTWDGWDAFATFLGALVCVTLDVAIHQLTG